MQIDIGEREPCPQQDASRDQARDLETTTRRPVLNQAAAAGNISSVGTGFLAFPP
jgi:hypothetical protein